MSVCNYCEHVVSHSTEIQEAAASLANAKENSLGAAAAAVLSEPDDIFALNVTLSCK